MAVTNEQKLLLVEQFRVPVDGPVIELPAGLSGDTDDPNESLQIAAERELLEETGYSAESWTELATVTSSAGMTNEQVTIFRAAELQKVSALVAASILRRSRFTKCLWLNSKAGCIIRQPEAK